MFSDNFFRELFCLMLVSIILWWIFHFEFMSQVLHSKHILNRCFKNFKISIFAFEIWSNSHVLNLHKSFSDKTFSLRGSYPLWVYAAFYYFQEHLALFRIPSAHCHRQQINIVTCITSASSLQRLHFQCTTFPLQSNHCQCSLNTVQKFSWFYSLFIVFHSLPRYLNFW